MQNILMMVALFALVGVWIGYRVERHYLVSMSDWYKKEYRVWFGRFLKREF